jgi:hypothetical protein
MFFVMVDPFLRNNTPEGQTPVAAQPSSTAAQAPVQQQVSGQQTAQGVPVPWAKPLGPRAKSFSLKTVLFGCLWFFVVLIGLAAFVLYLMVQNPDQYASIGLDRGTIQVLLQTFALLFFGALFFVWFGLLLTNGYKFITVKNKPRTRYIFLAIVGFVLLLFSIALWASVLTRISNLEVSRWVDSSSLLIPYIIGQNGPVSIVSTPNLSLIAPAAMVFQLNGALFNRQVAPLLWPVDIQSITMTCGNGTTLTMAPNAQFDGSCYYFNKWDYPLVLTVTHINRQTLETRSNTYEIGNLNFVSEIAVRVQDGTITRWQGELVAGRAPAKVTWDASAVFRDLGLPEYRVVWDIDGDGQVDAENVSDITWIYNEPKVYNISIRFPGINTFAYAFPLRIEQPDVPICILSVSQIQWTNYRIQADMTGRTARIDAYSFSVLDIADNRRVVGTQRATTNTIDYTFPGQWLYAVKLDFVTSDGRQGICESLNISVGQADFSVNYDMYFRSATDPRFIKVAPSTSVYFSEQWLVIGELPTILQVRIADIQPMSASADVSVFFNDVAILSSDDKIFEFRVNQRDGNRFRIVVDDPIRSANTVIDVPIVVEQAPVVGRLLIRPDTVGSDPFSVTLDASTTILNDTDDEIVYFTWNFGDGTVRTNLSQSVITHTYRYDYENDVGVFQPFVQILTKKWRSIVMKLDTDILVKKAVDEIVIRVDSHPAQFSRVWERVEFSLEISGLPQRIIWDFANGTTIEFPWRQGTSVSHVFTQNGNYTVKAIVEYENQPRVEGTIVLRVQ